MQWDGTTQDEYRKAVVGKRIVSVELTPEKWDKMFYDEIVSITLDDGTRITFHGSGFVGDEQAYTKIEYPEG